MKAGAPLLPIWSSTERWALSLRVLKAWAEFARQYPQIDWRTDTKRIRLADHTLNDTLNLYLERRCSDDDLKRIWRSWCETYLREARLHRKGSAGRELERLKVPEL